MNTTLRIGLAVMIAGLVGMVITLRGRKEPHVLATGASVGSAIAGVYMSIFGLFVAVIG